MLRVCGHPGCGTFTLGELCIEHEQSPAQRADRGRVRTVAAAVAGGCTAGDRVTIISRAFAAAHSFAGVPAVFAQVGSAGRFSTTTRIPATRSPGTYLLTARCGGGNLGVSARLAVTA